jgi:hypothetical protein
MPGTSTLDLADEHCRTVDIGPEGWRVIGCPPVRFGRPSGVLPLPAPGRGGSIEEPAGVDQSVLTISAPRRYRSKEHLRYVISQPCLFCARKPSDAHHLRSRQPRELGRKTSDEFAVALCCTHHRAAPRTQTSKRGGKRSALIRSKTRASSGGTAAQPKVRSNPTLHCKDAQTKVAPSTQVPERPISDTGDCR